MAGPGRPHKGVGYETVARESISQSVKTLHKQIQAVDLRLTARGETRIERLYFTDGSMLQVFLQQGGLLGQYFPRDPGLPDDDEEHDG